MMQRTLRRQIDRMLRRRGLSSFLAVALLTAGMNAVAHAQDETGREPVDVPVSEAPPTHETELPAALDQDGSQPRRWLMREGSLFVQARGTMDRDPGTGWWRFTVRGADDSNVKQTLGLLPCALLGEMVRIANSLEGRTAVYEITGQIYVYRGRNFLLPTIAPQLIEYGPPEQAEEPKADATPATTENGAKPAGDSAEDIIEDLEHSVGALARSAAPPAGVGDDAASAGGGQLVREQTMLLARRGQVTRTSTGAWMFVFDADAQGLADPPMILMPCLLLEHLEQRVWRSGAVVPVLISGRAYVFEDRNYLLPTAFQIARERTPLTQ